MGEQIFQQPSRRSGSQRRRNEEDDEAFQGWHQPNAVNDQSAQTSKNADQTVSNIDEALNQNAASNSDKYHDTFQDKNESFRDYSDAERNPKPVKQATDTNLGGYEKNPTRNEPAPYTATWLDKEKGDKKKGRFGTRKRKLGLAFGVGGGVSIILTGLMAGSLLFKGPLFDGFLGKAFGALTEHAVERRIRTYAFAWLSRDLFEGARRCGSTTKLTCIDRSVSKAPTGLAGTYITAMRQRKLNHELVARGISITRVQTEAGIHSFKIITKEGVTEVPDTAESIGRYRRQEIKNPRAAMREIKNITNQHFDGFLKRMVVKSVLRRAYGLPMCVLFCKKADNDKLRIHERFRERRIKYYNAQTATIGRRIIDQSSARQAILLKCLLGPCDIKKELRETDTAEARHLRSDPNQLEELERDGRKMNELANRSGGRTKALAKFAMHRILAKLAGEEAAKTTTAFVEKTIGPAGLAILAVMITYGAGEIVDWYRDYSGEHKAQKLWNQTKMAFDRGAYNQISTSSNEMFGAQFPTPTYDLASVAATNERLNGIEKAPAYPYTFGTLSDAKDTQKGIAKCTGNGDQPEEPEDGELYCMNDRLGVDPPWKRDYDKTGDEVGPFKYVRDILPGGIYLYSFLFGRLQGTILNNIEEFIIDAVFNNAVGSAVLGAISAAVKFILNLPGIKGIVKEAGSKLYDALATFFQLMFPMPAGDPSKVKGAVLGTAAMIGADVTYNDFARGGRDKDGKPYGLGAPAVSRKQANDLLAQIEKENREDLKYASISERFFSFTPDSFLARILMSEHTAAFSSPQNLAITSFNPFSVLFGSIGSLLSQKVSAGNPIMRAGASGMTQYTYLDGNPLIDAEPLTLTKEECDQKIEEGFKDSGKIDNLGQTVYDMTKDAQECLLDTAAVTAGTIESNPEQEL